MTQCCTNCSCHPTKGITYVEYILDASGSMDSLREDARGGFNAYIEDIKKSLAEENVRFSLTTFNTKDRPVYTDRPLNEVNSLTKHDYRPDGGTALLDAVARVLLRRDTTVRPEDKVLVIIMTDGEENSSVEFKNRQIVKEMIENREGRGNWTITLAGANIDAWHTGAGLGIKSGNTVSFRSDSPEAFKGGMRGMSVATANYVNTTNSSGLRATASLYNSPDLSLQTPVDVNAAAANPIVITPIPSVTSGGASINIVPANPSNVND